MKAKVFFYEHESNGLGIEIIPETDAETELLRAAWKHGKMETLYRGFAISVFKHREAVNEDRSE